MPNPETIHQAYKIRCQEYGWIYSAKGLWAFELQITHGLRCLRTFDWGGGELDGI